MFNLAIKHKNESRDQLLKRMEDALTALRSMIKDQDELQKDSTALQLAITDVACILED